MLAHMKSAWQKLADGTPGRRFQERFTHGGKSGKNRFGRKLVNICVGIVVTMLGIIFLPAPGPGSLVLIVGLGLLASEVRGIARILDWSELLIRQALRYALAVWQKASNLARTVICLAPLALCGVAAYIVF